ncbi:hypothetical protein LSTR_LSTR008485 [Laodelphax striatellus]|uniref:Uncharacterized protein n=1 Tax=Laodelphax striatellus TaxID=195883 RepID=A0A482WQP1_LAOST|nr:hypothetical protein LSTR_LSTR008485 [Laodelphax striatellus]
MVHSFQSKQCNNIIQRNGKSEQRCKLQWDLVVKRGKLWYESSSSCKQLSSSGGPDGGQGTRPVLVNVNHRSVSQQLLFGCFRECSAIFGWSQLVAEGFDSVYPTLQNTTPRTIAVVQAICYCQSRRKAV